MNKQEQQMMTDVMNIYKKVFKSLMCTLSIVFVCTFGVYGLIGLVFDNMSVEQSHFFGNLSLGIGIIFTIFYCTFTIKENLKEIKTIVSNGLEK